MINAVLALHCLELTADVQVQPDNLDILRHPPCKHLNRKLLVVSARARREAAENRLRRCANHISVPWQHLCLTSHGRAQSSDAHSH